jgi:tetratricopeptide (TPR) repeat protein
LVTPDTLKTSVVKYDVMFTNQTTFKCLIFHGLRVLRLPAVCKLVDGLQLGVLHFQRICICIVALLVSCAGSESFAQSRANNAASESAKDSIADKFGFIDKTGRVVIPPQFNYTSDFRHGIATGTLTDASGNPAKLITIDRNGHKLDERIPLGKSSAPREGDNNIVSVGPKYGYSSERGEIEIDSRFKSVQPFEGAYAQASAGDSWTPVVINRKGDIVIDLSKPPTDLSPDGFQIIRLPGATFCLGTQTGLSRFHDSLACVHRGTWCGYVDKTGSYVLPLQDCIANDFSEGLARVQTGLRQSYINEHGKKVFTLEGQIIDAGDFHEGRAAVLVRAVAVDARGQPLAKIGFIDAKGKMVIPPKILPEHSNRLDDLRFFDGLCRVSNGTKYGFIDRDGKLIIPYRFKYVANFHEGLAAAVPYPEDRLASANPAPESSDKNAQTPGTQTSAAVEERMKLSASLNGDPYFSPASHRLQILKKLVELDDSLKDTKAASEDLVHLAEVYQELGNDVDAELVWRRYLTVAHDAITAPIAKLLIRKHRYKELEEILTAQISKQEEADSTKVNANATQAAHPSIADATTANLAQMERDKVLKQEFSDSRFTESLLELGDLFFATEQYPKAKEQYERAYKIAVNRFPTAVHDFNEEARWRIILFDTQQGDFKGACDRYHELVRTTAAAGHPDPANNELQKSFFALLHLKSSSDFARETANMPEYAQSPHSPSWGFVDEHGKKIIAGQYTDAGMFNNGLANVAVLGGWGYIDRGNNWRIHPQFYAAEPFSEKLAAVSQSVELELPSLARYQQKPGMSSTGLIHDVSYGFIAPSGKYVIEPRFFEASSISQGVSAVCFGDGQICRNFGYVDSSGKTLMPPEVMATSPLQKSIAQLKIRHQSGNVTVKGEAKGIDRDFDVRLPVTSFAEWLQFFEQYLLTQKLVVDSSHVATTEFLNPWPEEDTFDARFGFIDVHGETLIKPQYTFARPFSDSLAAVQIKDKWGFIDTANKLVVPAIYDDAQSFDGSRARVQKSGQWGLVNKVGRIVLPCEYASISDFSEGLAVIAKTDGTHGFVDSKGTVVIPPTYMAARPFKNGFAAVQLNGRWGFIKKNGELAIAAEFKDVRDFSEGVAAVNFAE